MVPAFSSLPPLAGLIASEPEDHVVKAVVQAMDAAAPLSNLYFGADIDISAFGETLASRLAAVTGSDHLSSPARDLRSSYSFRAEIDASVEIWHGGESADWTIIAEESPLFATPPAPRTLFLKRWPVDPLSAFRFVASELRGILVFPNDLEAPIAGVPVLPMVVA